MEALEPVYNFVEQNGTLTIVLLTAILLLIRSVVVSLPKMVRGRNWRCIKPKRWYFLVLGLTAGYQLQK